MKKLTFICIIMSRIITVTTKCGTIAVLLKIPPPPVSRPLSLSSFFVCIFSSSSASSQAHNWAQLSAVTHCHSFISSLHHSFCPSADLGIHLSIHLSAPFSLTSGNDEERQRGEEKKERRAQRERGGKKGGRGGGERDGGDTWGNDWKAFKTQRGRQQTEEEKIIKVLLVEQKAVREPAQTHSRQSFERCPWQQRCTCQDKS